MAGFVSFRGKRTQEEAALQAEKMLSALHCPHATVTRTYSVPEAALGKRSLPAGAEYGVQPLLRTVEGGRYVLICDGTLSNKRELRRALLAEGCRFWENSDAEVMLQAYLHWGSGCVRKMRGVFSFVVWEEQKRRLYACCDALGAKALYYTLSEDGFVFATDIGGVLAFDGMRGIVDKDGLCELFAMRAHALAGGEVFRNIHMLEAGHFLLFREDGFQKTRYSQLTYQMHTEPAPDTAQTVRYLFDDAVRRSLGQAQGVCVLTSGGCHSAEVASAAMRLGTEQNGVISTCSLGADGILPYARHTELTLPAETILPDMLSAANMCGFPGADLSDAATVFLTDSLIKTCRILLCGMGGELFFSDASDLPACLQAAGDSRTFLRDGYLPSLADYAKECFFNALSEMPRFAFDCEQEIRRRENSYFLLYHAVLPTFAKRVQLANAAGLMLHAPLLDRRLINYLWNVPYRLREQSGFSFARVFSGAKPQKTPPAALPLLFYGAVKTGTARLLSDKTAPVWEIADPKKAEQLLQTLSPAGVRQLCLLLQTAAFCADPRMQFRD